MLHQTIICSFRKPAHFLILDHLKAPKSSINCLKSSRKRVNLEKVEFLENIGKLKQIIEQQGNTIDTTMQIIDTKDKLIEILNKLIDIKQIFMEIKDMQIKSLEKKIGSLKGVKSSFETELKKFNLLKSMTNLKIAVLGPSISGKSGISNILAGLNESLTSQYNETKGVRILEFDKVVSTGLKDNTTVVSIELWDFSGASDSAPNLFALIPNLNGILFVYPHPSSTNSLQTNTDYWTRHNLNVKCNAIVFANCITSSSKESIKVKFSSSVLANAPIVNTSLEAPNSITSEFDKFIGKSYRMFIEARNKEETV